MFSKVILTQENWYLGPKINPQNKSIGPIFDLPVSPAHSHAKVHCGSKVEDLETLEKPIRTLLKKSHIHLIKVRHTYKLKKIIFPTQVFKNYNRRKGYPEIRGLNCPTIKYSPESSTDSSDSEEESAPEIFSPVVAAPKKFPWNFHRAQPRPFKEPRIPEYISIPVKKSVIHPFYVKQEDFDV